MNHTGRMTFGLLISLFLSVFMIVYIVITFHVDDVSMKKGELYEFSTEWSNLIDHVGDNYDVTMKNTLPEKFSEEPALYLNTYHQAMQVFVGDQLIYDYGMDVSVTFGNSVASAIHIIPLDEEYEGKSITIFLTSAYKKNGRVVPTVMIGNERRIFYKIIAEHWALIVETIAMLVIALTLVIFWMASKRAIYATNSFLYLGISVLTMCTWFATNSQVFGLFFGNVTVLMYLCYISFFLIPLPILLYFDETIGKGFKREFGFLEGLSLFYFLGTFLLQFLNILNFKQLLPGVHLQLMCMLGLFAKIAIKRKKEGMIRAYRVHIVYCVVFCLIMMIIDLIRYYAFYGNDIAAFSRLGLIVYVLGLVIGMIQDSFDSIALANEAAIYEKLAFSDKLTGLFNRTAYESALKELDEEIKDIIYIRNGLVVISFDLNNLKKINDSQGHKQGDLYIKAFAKLLLKVFRENGDVFRTGGDEFIVIVQGANVEQAEKMVEQLNLEISAYNTDNENRWKGITLSTAYGISDYRPTIDNCIQDVIERSDQNMYSNKIRMKLAMGKIDIDSRL